MTQTGKDESVRQIDDVLENMRKMIVAADWRSLENLLSGDVSCTFTGEPEPVRGRDQVLDIWKKHLQKWDEVSIDRRGTVFRIRGDVAWGSFLWDGEASCEGVRYRLVGERWTMVLVAGEDGWRIAQTHTSLPYRNWEEHRLDTP